MTAEVRSDIFGTRAEQERAAPGSWLYSDFQKGPGTTNMKRTDPSPGLDSNLRTRAEPGGPAMEGGIEGASYRSVDVWRIGQYTVLRRLGEGEYGAAR